MITKIITALAGPLTALLEKWINAISLKIIEFGTLKIEEHKMKKRVKAKIKDIKNEESTLIRAKRMRDFLSD